MIKDRIIAGIAAGQKYYYGDFNSIFVLGPSGMGKTSYLDSIQHDLIEKHNTVIRISSHSSYQADQILPAFFRDREKAMVYSIKNGLPLIDRSPSEIDIKTSNATASMASRYAEMVGMPFNLTLPERRVLSDAFKKAIENKQSSESTMDSMLAELESSTGNVGAAKRAFRKIQELQDFKIIRDGRMSFHSPLTLIELNNTLGSLQSPVEEIVIRSIWSDAQADMFIKNPVTVILDEVHNLNWNDGILRLILVEGRKKGIRLLMASADTSLVSKHYSDIRQCYAKVYMGASVNDRVGIERIARGNVDGYIEAIRDHGILRQGEFICICPEIETGSGRTISNPYVFQTYIPD